MKTTYYRLLFALLLFVTLGTFTSVFAQITPSQDSYTNTAAPTTNFGAAPTLGVVSSASSIQTTYIQFNLSSVPAGYTGTNVAKATLKLYVNSVSTAGSFNVDLVNGSWGEKTITASLAPVLGNTIASGVPLTAATANNYVLINVTTAVQDWLNGFEPNDGIALVANSGLAATFDSKENTAQSHPAELDVVFTSGGTISGVTTSSGSGLSGGGASGRLNLSLLRTCATKQVLQWNGSAWACASVSGAGTISGVKAGTDLIGGGTSGTVTLSLDTTKVPQLNAANTFTSNQSITGNLMTSGSVTAGGAVLPPTGTATPSSGFVSQPLDFIAAAFNTNSNTSVNQDFRWQTEPISNNTVTPSGKLTLLFTSGAGTPAETGLSIASNGVLTFAAAQTFPGAGTLTGVTAGTDLTGGGTTGTITLNLDTTKVPQLNSANNFAGNQSVTGKVSASQLIATASNGTTPLVVSSTTQVANLNASLLGGLPPSAFAELGASNEFNGNQTINGYLVVSQSINGALTLQGSVVDPSGNESANVIGGFGGNIQFPGNSVANGVVGATIAGGGGASSTAGFQNTVTADWGTVGGGSLNTASASATVAGGSQNSASGSASAIGGGSQNTAGAGNATVAGGGNNNASGLLATVGGGAANMASGFEATVPGGSFNTAAGDHSFAAGNSASASNNGSFVWADSSTAGVGVGDTGPNQFVARAAGGFTFYSSSDLTTGATLAHGSGSWSSLSDRNVKTNVIAVDGKALLERLAALPISTWNYKAQSDSVRHMGPMAQDFRAAFGLGEDERHISTVDAQGVALAAIQALYCEVLQKQQEVTSLRAEVGKLQQVQDRLAELESRLALIEAPR